MKIYVHCLIVVDARRAEHEMPGTVVELEEGEPVPEAGKIGHFTDDDGDEWRCRIESVEQEAEDTCLVRLVPLPRRREGGRDAGPVAPGDPEVLELVPAR